ncbi:L,D-transpeptidase [Pseudonocardia dioxanivorans]|uniref:L,D-transpeptidase n=1 Tax=Pseudonocardia dioxanivorans TaxID=240495 RepID=UPI001F3B4691|nr:L,D-transpeptidase [Pseudonocardia dioxanivorans]
MGRHSAAGRGAAGRSGVARGAAGHGAAGHGAGRSRLSAMPRVRATIAFGLAGLGALGGTGVGSAEPLRPVEAPLVDGTPCTVAARACVSIGAKQAWLLDDGRVVRGPVAVSTGGAGKETPRGAFGVEWKNRDHRSAEFGGAPMPFAVFFAPGGIAFHEGDTRTGSAGCVRLARADAEAFHDFLAVGDRVEIV